MDNNTKIEIALNNLSNERRNHINLLIQNAVNSIPRNSNENLIYDLEMTERFDREEPHQFVWLSFKVSFQKLGFSVPTPNGMVEAIQQNAIINDIEIYTPPNIDGWLDHTKRIKEKEDNLLNHKKENGDSNAVKNNINNQSEINEEDDFTEEEKEALNELEWLFTPLFNSVHQKKYTSTEYIKIFTRYSSVFANRVMGGFINFEEKPLITIQDNIKEALVMLTTEFQNCDFTQFSKEQLEILGFINWKNKVLMIPIWAYPIILKNNKGLLVKNVIGDEYIIGKNYISTETVNGYVSVGIPIIKVSKNFYKIGISYHENWNEL